MVRIDASGRLTAGRCSVSKCEGDHPEVVVRREVAQGAPRGALLDAASEAQLLVVGAPLA